MPQSMIPPFFSSMIYMFLVLIGIIIFVVAIRKLKAKRTIGKKQKPTVFDMIIMIAVPLGFFMYFPFTLIFDYYYYKNRMNTYGFKRYKEKDFRGNAQESIGFRYGEAGFELYLSIKESMQIKLQENGIDAIIQDGEATSGSIFKKTVLPMLVIHNSDNSKKFFDIGILINENIVMFPLLGQSVENTKYNKNEYYTKNKKYFKASLNSPDKFKLQQESEWINRVLECFNSMVD